METKLYQLLVVMKRHIEDCIDEMDNGTGPTKMAFVTAKLEVIGDLCKAACSDDPCVFD